MINLQDRKDYLLDTGVSPGEDDSYDEQAKKLIAQQGSLRDNAKQNLLQRLEVLIKSNRHRGAPDGPPNPLEFAAQVASKVVPTPSELGDTIQSGIKPMQSLGKFDPTSIADSAPALMAVAKSHPLALLKQAALNPPEPSTLAALAVPEAALAGYRNLVPLAARTYIHHMAGIPTPFTHVTEAERTALTEMAQTKIDYFLKKTAEKQKYTAEALQNIAKLKTMSPNRLYRYVEQEGLYIPEKADKTAEEIRGYLIDQLKARLEMAEYGTSPYAHGMEKTDRVNVAKDYETITGEKLKGFEVFPTVERPNGDGYHSFNTALGKTYVEPMVDKATGKIVPKRIQDTYKFYPDVYSYGKGQGLYGIKKEFRFLMDDLKPPHKGGVSPQYRMEKIMQFFKEVLNMDSQSPAGILARKVGMKRPTSIIDINLQGAAKMNAYDKAAILLGGKPLAEQRK